MDKVFQSHVLCEDGYKNIEDIQVSDRVLAYDEQTGENTYKEVVRLFRNTTECWYHIKINGEEIQCTAEHPIYVESKGFVLASKLPNQDKLVQANGTIVEIQSITVEHLATPETTYNFEVADYHTYYVTKQEVFVHDKCRAANHIKPDPNATGGTQSSKQTPLVQLLTMRLMRLIRSIPLGLMKC